MVYELYHHGVKGMKWGVRRYQNKDGTLTEKGRLRLRKTFGELSEEDKKYYENVDKELSRKGVVKGDQYDIIKRGTVLGRYSSTDKETNSGLKYASITEHDDETYGNMASAGMLGFTQYEKISKYKLSAISDIKVATGKKVCNDIINKYGDTLLKDLWKTHDEFNLRENTDIPLKLRQMSAHDKNRWAYEYANDTRNAIYKALNNALVKDKSIRDEIIQDLAKQGYDAMVDVEDWSGGFDYPVIIFDSERTLKQELVK